MQRDILTERDWFLIVLMLLGCVALGADLVLGAHYLQIAFNFGAIFAGLLGVAWLAVLPFYVRYNRWGYLTLTAFALLRLVLGIAQAVDGTPASPLYHFGGYVNGILGLIFVVGLLARWSTFMQVQAARDANTPSDRQGA